MVIINRLILFAAGLAVTILVPANAAAQTGVQAEVGYSFLRITEGDGLNLPVGWLVSVAGPAGSWFAIVGEVAGNYRTESGQTLRVHTFQGGLRLSTRRGPSVRPYGQFLLGGANASGDGDSETRFSIEPGGGLDVPLGGRLAVRAGIGVPIVFVDGDTVKGFRFHVGLVF